MQFLWIAVGGAMGAVARHATGLLMKRLTGAGHWGTLTVNLIGSFLIGFVFCYAAAKDTPENLRLGIVTGFIGAFTTFSTFNLDAYALFSKGHHREAVIYLSVSIISGLALAFAGVAVGRQLFPGAQ